MLGGEGHDVEGDFGINFGDRSFIHRVSPCQSVENAQCFVDLRTESGLDRLWTADGCLSKMPWGELGAPQSSYRTTTFSILHDSSARQRNMDK